MSVCMCVYTSGRACVRPRVACVRPCVCKWVRACAIAIARSRGSVTCRRVCVRARAAPPLPSVNAVCLCTCVHRQQKSNGHFIVLQTTTTHERINLLLLLPPLQIRHPIKLPVLPKQFIRPVRSRTIRHRHSRPTVVVAARRAVSPLQSVVVYTLLLHNISIPLYVVFTNVRRRQQ